MDFGMQIKNIRLERNLTQEQMSQKLNVSRQAVSNWENNRNLPDIEMLITMAVVFHISLDQLILGGNDMNNMTKKLIKDGSENRGKRNNMISFGIGGALLLTGIICFAARPPVTMDADGFLTESLLTPISFMFFFCATIVFIVTGIRNLPLIGGIGIILTFFSGITAMTAINSWSEVPVSFAIPVVMGIGGIAMIIYGVVRKKINESTDS